MGNRGRADASDRRRTMMLQPKRKSERLLWHLIPILIGVAGVQFSNQFEETIVRFIVVLVSVAIPVFAIGILLARGRGEGVARIVLLVGVVMLVVGAAASLVNPITAPTIFPARWSSRTACSKALIAGARFPRSSWADPRLRIARPRK